MNTLITWNQLRDMEEATQNRFNRFLGGFPNRIGSGETHSLTVADWSPEVDITEDDRGYLLKADLPEMKKDDVRVTVEDGVLCVSGERQDQNQKPSKLKWRNTDGERAESSVRSPHQCTAASATKFMQQMKSNASEGANFKARTVKDIIKPAKSI